jgi:hypothetical protein
MRSNLIALLSVLTLTVNAQVQPTVKYDSTSANYLIEFEGSKGIVRSVFEPATKIAPQIIGVVERASNQTEYVYSYVVSNGQRAKQRLLKILIEFGSRIFDVTRPNTEWSALTYAKQPMVSWAHTRVDPAGLWTAYNGIPSDSTAGGFSYKSRGLPRIVDCHFQGATPTLQLDEEPPYEIEAALDSLEVFPNNTVRGKTLGPADPPVPFHALALFDSLISYKHQALALGWITNKGIVNSLDQKLDNARKQLQRGNNKTAKNILEAFINEVEAQKDKHLSSEAYALLKFNAEYLVSKLQ